MAPMTTTSPSTPAPHLLSVIIFVFVFHMIYFSSSTSIFVAVRIFPVTFFDKRSWCQCGILDEFTGSQLITDVVVMY
jgi:hypothetical protein